jgi:hypothetical protein
VAYSRYLGIDDTIVQLFISQASVLMARVAELNRNRHNQDVTNKHLGTEYIV